MMKPFRKIYIRDNEDLSRVQDSVGATFSSLESDTLLNHVTITAAFSGASSKIIRHTLGKVPNGWILIDNDSNANIWRTAWTSETITLESSTTVNIKFYLF